jgi:hypothetical protein
LPLSKVAPGLGPGVERKPRAAGHLFPTGSMPRPYVSCASRYDNDSRRSLTVAVQFRVLSTLGGLIPALDYARFALVAEDADRSGREGEEAAAGGRQPQPAGCQNSQHVTVSE